MKIETIFKSSLVLFISSFLISYGIVNLTIDDYYNKFLLSILYTAISVFLLLPIGELFSIEKLYANLIKLGIALFSAYFAFLNDVQHLIVLGVALGVSFFISELMKEMVSKNFKINDSRKFLFIFSSALVIIIYINQFVVGTYFINPMILIILTLLVNLSVLLISNYESYIEEVKVGDLNDFLDKVDETKPTKQEYNDKIIQLINSVVFNILLFICFIKVSDNVVSLGLVNNQTKIFGSLFIIISTVNKVKLVFSNEKYNFISRVTRTVSIFIVMIVISFIANDAIIKYRNGNINQLVTPFLFLAIAAYIRMFGKLGYKTRFSFMYVSAVTLAALYYFNVFYTDSSLIYVAISYVFTVLNLFVYLSYKLNQKIDDEKKYMVSSVIKIALIVFTLSLVMNFIQLSVFENIANALFELFEKEDVVKFATFNNLVIVSGLASLIFIRVNVDSKRLMALVIVIKYLAVILVINIYIQYLNIVSGSSNWVENLATFATINAISTAFYVGSRASEKNLKFLMLFLHAIGCILVLEILFYVTELLYIELPGLSFNDYRLIYGLYFGVLTFTYVYMRNMKFGRRNPIYTLYRGMTVSMVTILMVSIFVLNASPPDLKSEWIKEKVIDYILNSDLVEYLDPGILDDILDKIDIEDLPEDFDYEDIAERLPTYIELNKTTSDFVFIKESASSSYSYNSSGNDGGWNFGLSGSAGEKVNETDFSNLFEDKYTTIDDFFTDNGAINWDIKETLNYNIINSYKMDDNLLPLSVISSELNTEIPTSIKVDNRGSVYTSEKRLESYSAINHAIDYESSQVLAALNRAYENNVYDDDATGYLDVDDALRIKLRNIVSEIDSLNDLDNKNDYIKLLAISNYIKANFEIDLFQIWYKDHDIDDLLETKKGDIGEGVTLYTMLARMMDIPVRTMLGYVTSGSNYEIKKEINIPSLEFNIPGLGFVDGSHLMLAFVSSNVNNIPGVDDEDLTNIVFEYQKASSQTIFLRQETASGYIHSNNNYSLLYNKGNGICSGENSTPHSQIQDLQDFYGYYPFKDSIGVISKKEANSSIYSPYFVEQLAGVGTYCRDIYDNLDISGYVNEYTYHSNLLDWSNTNFRRSVIDDYDAPYDYKLPDALMTVHSDIEIQLKLHGYVDVYNDSINIKNEFSKIYIVNKYMTENYSITNDNNNLMDVIENKVGTREQVFTVYFSLLRMLGIDVRITKGYTISGFNGSVTTEDYDFNLEIYIPNFNGWVPAPDELNYFEEYDDLNVYPGEGVVGEGTVYSYSLYEMEERNLCDENLLEFRDPLTNSVIGVSRQDIAVRATYDEDLITGEADFMSGCTYEFTSPGKYVVLYDVRIESSGIVERIELHINAKPAEPVIIFNTNFDFLDNYIILESNTLKVLHGVESNYCEVMRAFDTTTAIIDDRLDDLYTQYGLGMNSDNIAELSNCLYSFDQLGEFTLTFHVVSPLPINISESPAIREKTVTINVEVYEATAEWETRPTDFDIFETQTVDIRNLALAKYKNGFIIDVRKVDIDINGSLLQSNIDTYDFMENPGSNAVMSIPIRYKIDAVGFGQDAIINILVDLYSAEPGNYTYNEDPACNGVLNGQSLFTACGKGFDDLFSVENVLEGSTANLEYNYSVYVDGSFYLRTNNEFYRFIFDDNLFTGEYLDIRVEMEITERTSGRDRVYISGVLESLNLKVYIDELSMVAGNTSGFMYEDETKDLIELYDFRAIDKLDMLTYSVLCELYDENGFSRIEIINCNYLSDLNSAGKYKVEFTSISSTGDYYSIMVDLEILESIPVFDNFDETALGDIYAGSYEYYLCKNINARDIFNNSIKDNIHLSIDGGSLMSCQNADNYSFANIGTYNITYQVLDRGYIIFKTINITVIENNNPPIIDLTSVMLENENTSELELNNVLSNEDYNSNEDLNNTSDEDENLPTREHDTMQRQALNLCELITATDPIDGTILFPSSIENSENVLITDTCNDGNNNFSYYPQNPGVEKYYYYFSDKSSNNNSIKALLILNIEEVVYNVTSFYDIQTLNNRLVNIELHVYDFLDGEIFVKDSRNNLSKDFGLSVDLNEYNDYVEIGDIYFSVFRVENNVLVLEDDYPSTSEDAYFSFHCFSTLDLDNYEGGFYNVEFKVVSSFGSRYLEDQCGRIDLHNFENKILNSDISLEKNYTYVMNIIITSTGIYIYDEPTFTEPPSLIPYIILVCVFLLVVTGLISRNILLKRNKNVKEKKIEDDVVLQDKDDIHLSRKIEVRYINIIKLIKVFKGKKNRKFYETHNEYARRLFDMYTDDLDSVFMDVTEVFNRCRYYKDSINRNDFDLVVKYYDSQYDYVLSKVSDERLKKRILKLRKF